MYVHVSKYICKFDKRVCETILYYITTGQKPTGSQIVNGYLQRFTVHDQLALYRDRTSVRNHAAIVLWKSSPKNFLQTSELHSKVTMIYAFNSKFFTRYNTYMTKFIGLPLSSAAINDTKKSDWVWLRLVSYLCSGSVQFR